MNSEIGRLPQLGIGEASRLYGMSLRAIRLYEERGLLVSKRDRRNKRYFDEAARSRLDWICLLRKAGLGLYDIGVILAAEDRELRGRNCALERLAARRRALGAELDAVQRVELQLSNKRSTSGAHAWPVKAQRSG